MSLSAKWFLIRGIPKTVIFTIRYFGWSRVTRPPVFVSHLTKLKSLAGEVIVPEPYRVGGIRIGFGDVGIFDKENRRSIWENSGTVRFRGSAHLGHGSCISVGPSGHIDIGDGFCISSESTIRCARAITFGAHCLLSWDVLMMDEDFHAITDDSGCRINPDSPITIGDHVWICCRSLILKGSQIASNSVVGANALVTSRFSEQNVLLAGNPAKVHRRGINWHFDQLSLGRAYPVEPGIYP